MPDKVLAIVWCTYAVKQPAKLLTAELQGHTPSLHAWNAHASGSALYHPSKSAMVLVQDRNRILTLGLTTIQEMEPLRLVCVYEGTKVLRQVLQSWVVTGSKAYLSGTGLVSSQACTCSSLVSRTGILSCSLPHRWHPSGQCCHVLTMQH